MKTLEEINAELKVLATINDEEEVILEEYKDGLEAALKWIVSNDTESITAEFM